MTSIQTFAKGALALAMTTLALQAAAQVTFYEHEGFQGRSFSTPRQVRNFERQGFGDRASSVVVLQDRWEVCDDTGFAGRCVVLRPGRYPSLRDMGLNDRVSSVRPVAQQSRIDDNRYPPPPMPVYDNRRRANERLFEAEVTSARAVVGPGEQRCWIEREEIERQHGGANVPGAIVGALLGGVLGHQIGGGSGRDAATVVGVIGGGAVGANVGRDRGRTQDVRRCENMPSQARPEYWDVTYTFRGVEHHMQSVTPPGRTVTVNRRGEPRADPG